jgi:hypothetical protein
MLLDQPAVHISLRRLKSFSDAHFYLFGMLIPQFLHSSVKYFQSFGQHLTAIVLAAFVTVVIQTRLGAEHIHDARQILTNNSSKVG